MYFCIFRPVTVLFELGLGVGGYLLEFDLSSTFMFIKTLGLIIEEGGGEGEGI